MSVRFQDGSELMWRGRPPCHAPGTARRDPRRFADWQGLSTAGPDVLSACRALLTEDTPAVMLRAQGAAEVKAAIAELVRVGRLWWIERPIRHRPFSTPPAAALSEEAVSALLAASAPAAGTSAPSAAPPPQDIPAHVDQQCLADALVSAAASGTPFCEECQRQSARGIG